jgi:hypothetical protein
MNREDGLNGSGRFVAETDAVDERRFPLVPRNISRDFWHDGAEASMADFPLLGRGPFGQAVQFHEPKEQNDLPVLLVPRADLHDTRLDAKGPGKSVSMVVWLIYQGDNHAIAGIWHEGTDTIPNGIPAEVRVRGRRQYGMFAGLSANPGAPSVHISENGLASFADKYARHLAVSPHKMTQAPLSATSEQLDASWSAIGFVYDNQRKTVTAYLNGNAEEYWVENPDKSNFYRPAAKAWKQSWLSRQAGPESDKDPAFPQDQLYQPPETTPLHEFVEHESAEEQVLLRTYEFTKVRVHVRKSAGGELLTDNRELVALKANPWYIGHDIYAPPSAEAGGPFTIGRVIHSNRHGTLNAWFGGVAVYDRALSANEMAALAKIGRSEGSPLLQYSAVVATEH